jgi:hypothetical protein
MPAALCVVLVVTSAACHGLGPPPVALITLGEFRYRILSDVGAVAHTQVALSSAGDESVGYVQQEPLESLLGGRLVTCGVPVVKPDEGHLPMLEAQVAVRRHRKGFAYVVSLELSENGEVLRATGRRPTSTLTWQETRLGDTARVSVGDLNSQIQGCLAKLVAQFCEEYRDAHGR